MEELPEKAKKYKSAKEFVEALGIDKNLEEAYIKIYGEKARDTFHRFKELYEREELGRLNRGRTIRDLRADSKYPEINLPKLFQTIRENLEGFKFLRYLFNCEKFILTFFFEVRYH